MFKEVALQSTFLRDASRCCATLVLPGSVKLNSSFTIKILTALPDFFLRKTMIFSNSFDVTEGQA